LEAAKELEEFLETKEVDEVHDFVHKCIYPRIGISYPQNM
jgi:hypothetical protein